MGNVFQTIIEPMTNVWGTLEGESQDQALDVYERVLCGYDDATLDAAFTDVAANWIPRYKQPWPAPAMFKQACDKALKMQPKSPIRQHDAPWVEPSQESKDRVAAMTRELVANMKMFEAKNNTSTRGGELDENGQPKVWKGRTYFGVTREDFEGRYSTVLGCRWHSPTLAEVIARQDAEKARDDGESF